MKASPDVIAGETLIGFNSDNERFPITIVIERPIPEGENSNFACWITVDPLFRRFAIRGASSLQALALGLRHVKWELERFQEEGGVIEDFDLEDTLPFRSLDETVGVREP